MKKRFTIIVRKNPIVIVKNFIMLEVLGYVAFLIAGALADYGQIYNQLSISQVLSYHIAYLMFIVFCEMLISVYIFSAWYFDYYQIQPDALVHVRGILLRKKDAVPIADIESVRPDYGSIGKLFGYGTLVVRLSSSGKDVQFSYVSSPQRYVAFIKKLKQQGAAREKMSSRRPPLDDVGTLLSSTENEFLEFKATMRWDMQLQRINRQLEKAIMKSIAAFLNSGGGYIVLGVDDARKVVGLSHDYRSLTKHDADAFENHFTLVFNSAIGAEYRQYVSLVFKKHGGEDICIIDVLPSEKPAYVRFDNSEEFYVRTGNTTTSLKLSEAQTYIDLWRERQR